jgi:hypothetical protein
MISNFNYRRVKDFLIGIVAGMILVGFVQEVSAEAIATAPNQAGGKIVLTDEPCVHQGKRYNGLNRAYNYGTQGYTTEGCYVVEDETVVVIWDDGTANSKMRYPAENFTLMKRRKAKGGTQI